MSPWSTRRFRLLRAVGTLAVVAVLATPALSPAAAADDAEPAPPEAVELTEPTDPTATPEPTGTPESSDPTDPAIPIEPTQPEPTEETVEPQASTPVAPVAPGPTCLGGAFGTGANAGASNPFDGTRWVATMVAPGRLSLSRALGGGAVTPPLAILDLPGAPGAAGGLTFGTDGRLFVVAAADDGGESVLYRTALPVRPSARPVVATEVSRSRTDAPVTRIAFARDGLLHLVDAGGSTVTDPVTGETAEVLDAATSATVACGRPSQLTLRVSLPAGRVAPGDQLAVGLGAAAYDGTPAAPRGVTAGADTGHQAKLGEYVQVLALPGAAYDLSLTTADGGQPTAYDVALRCLDGTESLVDQPVVAGTLTMPTRSAYVSCTFTATPAAVDEPEPQPEPQPEPRASGPRPSVLMLDKDAGLPGGGVGTDRDQGAPKDDTDPGGGTGDQGRDLGQQMQQDGALGGGLGGGMPGSQEQTDTQETKGDNRAKGPLDPVLPNTGGPPAVVLPAALGAIVLGSVLVARRRRRV